MTAENTLTDFYAITKLERGNIYFGTRKPRKKGETFTVRKLQAENKVIRKLEELILSYLATLKTTAKVASLRRYQPHARPGWDEPRFLKLDEEPALKAVYDSIIVNTALIKPYKPKEARTGNLSYYCLRAFDEGGEEVRFYQRMQPNKQLRKARGLQAMQVDGNFVLVEDRPLTFDPEFIAATYKGHIFIFGSGDFETLFQFFEELRDEAQADLQKISGEVIEIHNLNKFLPTVVNNNANIKRIRGLGKRGHLQKFTFERVKRVLDGPAGFTIKVEQTQQGKLKILWAAGEEEQVLKLLLDYDKEGVASGVRYGDFTSETLSKSP